MSATGRSDKRVANDYYQTPVSCIESLLNKYMFPEDALYLDPCVGEGAIIKCVKSKYPDSVWSGVDIDIKHGPTLQQMEIPYLIKDFMQITPADISMLTGGKDKFDVIITNPPYSCAQEFIVQSLKYAKHVVMLLRLNFLESQKRSLFFKNNMPDVKVLSKRPSFTGRGTDACAYSWMVWDSDAPQTSGRIEILG